MRYLEDNELAISRTRGRASNLDQTRPSEGRWVRRGRKLLLASAASATLAGVFVGAAALPSAAGPGDWGITGDGKEKTTDEENKTTYDNRNEPKPKPKQETVKVDEPAPVQTFNFPGGIDFGKGEIGQSGDLLAENFDITAPTEAEWTNFPERLARDNEPKPEQIEGQDNLSPEEQAETLALLQELVVRAWLAKQPVPEILEAPEVPVLPAEQIASNLQPERVMRFPDREPKNFDGPDPVYEQNPHLSQVEDVQVPEGQGDDQVEEPIKMTEGNVPRLLGEPQPRRFADRQAIKVDGKWANLRR